MPCRHPRSRGITQWQHKAVIFVQLIYDLLITVITYAVSAVDPAAVVNAQIPIAVLWVDKDVWETVRCDVGSDRDCCWVAWQRVQLRHRTVIQQVTPEYHQQQCCTVHTTITASLKNLYFLTATGGNSSDMSSPWCVSRKPMQSTLSKFTTF